MEFIVYAELTAAVPSLRAAEVRASAKRLGVVAHTQSTGEVRGTSKRKITLTSLRMSGQG